MAEIAQYQKNAIDKLLEFLPQGASSILEIGSDLDCCVLDSLAGIVNGVVAGLNPSKDFPRDRLAKSNSRYHTLRSDGCCLPFKDDSFDAIISIATMEHVHDLERFLAECDRVLRPGGFFYTKFSPIWSCGIGHHVYAVTGHKEARFWKPGKNPLPDFSHLLWSPEEMRDFLHTGPCDERLIEPVLSWVYCGKDINRLFLEDYLKAFQKSPLKNLICNLITYCTPPEDILEQLKEKYGSNHNFSCQGIEAVFVKEISPEELNKQGEELFNKGEINGALGAFLKVIEMDSGFATAYNNLGVLYWQTGDVQKAIQYFASALENDPDDRNTVLNCGKILTVLEKEEDVNKLYSSYLQRNPDDDEISQLLADLEGENGNEKKVTQSAGTGTAMKDGIEILSIGLMDEHKNLVDMIYGLSNKLGIGLGWHYVLDIVWIILNIRDLPKGSIVLDAGAGNGLLQCVLAGLGYKVISADFSSRTPPESLRNNWNIIEVDDGVDYDNEYISQLKENFPDAYEHGRCLNRNNGMDANEFESRLHSTDRVIVYYRTDFTNMELIKDRSVDCVVSLSALEHNNPDSIKDAFNEFKRVLKPNHKMLMTMSAADKKDWFHKQSKGWCFTEKSLAGFFDLYSYQSNYHLYYELFNKLKDGKGLRENLAPEYFKSGNNGMPWGIWDPKYQPVGVLKNNSDALSKVNIVKKCNGLYDDFTSDIRYLQHIFLDVNNNCNLRCIMCSRDNRREKTKNMTPDEFVSIAEKCFRNVRNLQISCAWEASISKYTPEILSLLPGYNVPNTSFLTNGNYMSDDLMRAIFDSGLNRLSFSIEETDPGIYSKIRRKGDFNKVIKHIEMISTYKKQKGLRLPQLGANMTIMKSNIGELPAFMKFAAKMGIEVLTGRHLILLEDCDTGDEILYKDIERTNTIIREARILAQQNNLIFNVPFLSRAIEKKFLCTRPWDTLYISSNGDVSCCPRISRIRRFGNLLVNSYEEVFYTNTSVDSLRLCFLNGCHDNEICKWCAEGLEQREPIDQKF